MKALLETLGIDNTPDVDPNPVPLAAANAAAAALRESIPPAPDWLRGSSVVAIGGPNCLFAVSLRALGKEEARLIVPEDLEALLVAVADREDLRAVAGTHEFAESPSLVVAKAALFHAVATHLELSQVHFQPCIGSCAGVLITEEFWST